MSKDQNALPAAVQVDIFLRSEESDQYNLNAREVLVLKSIADRQSYKEDAWPSFQYLHKYTRLARSTVQLAIKSLEKKNLLFIEKTAMNNHYCITLPSDNVTDTRYSYDNINDNHTGTRYSTIPVLGTNHTDSRYQKDKEVCHKKDQGRKDLFQAKTEKPKSKDKSKSEKRESGGLWTDSPADQKEREERLRRFRQAKEDYLKQHKEKQNGSGPQHIGQLLGTKS